MWIPRKPLVQRIHDHMLARMGGEAGPLNPNNLDVAIGHAKTFVYGHEPYKNAVSKAAALGYGIISWHPFLDGNKRTAVFTMFSMLQANGIEMILPPYIVKYSVQAALAPESGRHIEEREFISKISSICCRPDSTIRSWKKLRYERYPGWLLGTYIRMARQNPKRYTGLLGRIIFDWYAAEDPDTMTKTLQEWQLRTGQGYPREIPPLEIHQEDFEELGPPGESLQRE